jgi:hypothetical protein
VFSADADTTNSACTVTDTGAVSFQHAGSCVVDAEQEGNTDYSAATTAQQAIPVGAAATATTIAVTSHEITATTTATNPAAGTPTGTVSFSVDGTTVGTAPLNAGVAELPYTVPAGSTRDVAAVYGGSADFTGSSVSTNRTNPTIRAKVSSTRPKTRSGWYSRPVTVTFTCTDNAAQLASRCPAPVTLKHNGAGQSVTRTVTAMNGGAATVTVTNINIDRTKPSVHVSGVRKGGTYRGTAPHLNCVAKDNLSGVSSCTIRTTASLTGKTKYIATATNGAGLSAKSRGHYLQIPVWLQHTPWRNNAFQVRSGRTVTLRAASHSRPHYLWAAPVTAGRSTPHGGNTGFVPIGTHQWKLRVWLNKAMTKRYSLWNMGVRFGGKLHIVRIAFQQ